MRVRVRARARARVRARAGVRARDGVRVTVRVSDGVWACCLARARATRTPPGSATG